MVRRIRSDSDFDGTVWNEPWVPWSYFKAVWRKDLIPIIFFPHNLFQKFVKYNHRYILFNGDFDNNNFFHYISQIITLKVTILHSWLLHIQSGKLNLDAVHCKLNTEEGQTKEWLSKCRREHVRIRYRIIRWVGSVVEYRLDGPLHFPHVRYYDVCTNCTFITQRSSIGCKKDRNKWRRLNNKGRSRERAPLCGNRSRVVTFVQITTFRSRGWGTRRIRSEAR